MRRPLKTASMNPLTLPCPCVWKNSVELIMLISSWINGPPLPRKLVKAATAPGSAVRCKSAWNVFLTTTTRLSWLPSMNKTICPWLVPPGAARSKGQRSRIDGAPQQILVDLRQKTIVAGTDGSIRIDLCRAAAEVLNRNGYVVVPETMMRRIIRGGTFWRLT